MITIARLKEILGLLIAESEIAKSFITGVADEDITARLEKVKRSEYPVLVAIVPSMMGAGRNMDQLRHTCPMFIYCIEPIGNYSEDEMDERWDELMLGVMQVEDCIRKHESDPEWEEFTDIAPDSIHIDPELGMWNCFGWSISFDIVY